ncbi:MAG: DNRLRE domain-containing protein, partial [Clostridia bacterium]|nr:DNRLRE domain-containing protein [Clostridia bacterium]
MTFARGSREISWRYIPDDTRRCVKSTVEISRHKAEEPWNHSQRPSLKYSKADEALDIAYEMTEAGVKESIVLAKPPRNLHFKFELKLQGLIPQLSEDKKTVLLYADDRAIKSADPELMIPPANMIDSSGAYSEDIHYELHDTKHGLFLELVMENAWLIDKEREYPVVIDPRVEIPETSTDTNAFKMIDVCSDSSVTETGNYRTVGIDESCSIHRVYMDFDLPTLPLGYKITRAALVLHQWDCESFDGTESYDLHAPESTWDAGTISWSNQPGFSAETKVGSLQAYHRAASEEVALDITQTVNNWYRSPDTANGLLLKLSEEQCECCNGCVQPTYIKLFSPNSATANYNAQLCIEYASADMYADHQKYHTFDMGRAGIGSINLFTGAFSFAHGDVTTEGVNLPLSVSHVYRPELVGESITPSYGKGWRLSVEQKVDILKEPADAEEGELVAIYTNAQGRRHYFIKASNGYAMDDTGLGLVFTKETNSGLSIENCHCISDGKGNRLFFNGAGTLLVMMDANGNKNVLRYEEGALACVMDGDNQSIGFNFDEDFRLTDIGYQTSNQLTYEYDQNDRLIAISYSAQDDDRRTHATTFWYNSANDLTHIYDNTAHCYQLTYEKDAASGIKKVKELRYFGARGAQYDSLSGENTVEDDTL